MKVLGVDPGLAATGVGLVWGRGLAVDGFSYGCLTTAAGEATAIRLTRIYEGVIQILREARPDRVVVEDVFSLQCQPRSGILLGKVCGVILLAAGRAGLETDILEIPTREAKRVLTGNGNASKSQLERAVRRHLGNAPPISPSHASDALALALIGLFRCG